MVHGLRELVCFSHAKELTIHCLTSLYHWTMRVIIQDPSARDLGHDDLLYDTTLTCQQEQVAQTRTHPV